MMTKLRTLGLVLCVGLASAPPAHADVVTDWNAVTLLYYLTDHGLAGDPALEVGEAAAVALHTNHYRPTLVVDPFIGGTGIGEWRPVPPTAPTTPLSFLFLASTEPFALKRPSQFRPEPPPPLKSRRYARDYDEVKARGNIAAHPNSETDLGLFWSGKLRRPMERVDATNRRCTHHQRHW